MKRIGVVSDSHGNLEQLRQIVALSGEVDLWLHAGDHLRDARWLAGWCGVPVVAVAGNCDRPSDGKVDEFIELEGMLIWLTHGHRQHVKTDRSELLWWAEQYGADIVVYGHTHRSENRVHNSALIFNPGSLAHPRDTGPSWGLLTLEAGRVQEAKILYFQG